MSNESVVLWVDVQNNTLLSGWESNAQAPDPVFKQGDNLQAELHFVRRVSTQAGVFFEEVPTDGATFKFAIGRPDARPTSGTWTLAYGSDEQDFAYNVSAEDLETALNAFTDIIAQGGVTVESVNGNTTYRISFNNKTAVGNFTADGTNLFPSSSVIIDQIKVGSPTVRGVWHIKPTQIPVAYQSTWTPQVPSAVTVETVQTGTTRVKIFPAPKDGTFILSVGGLPTPAISVYATANEIVEAIGDTESGFDVKKSGAFIWDITQTTTPLRAITANGAGIISFDSVVGNISFNNYETSTLLAGANSVRTTLEIEMTVGNTVTTVLQDNCVIVTNLINQTVYEPTPFETPLTDAPEDGSLYARKDGEWVSFTEEDNQGITLLVGDARYAQQANNLSDLDDLLQARTNLGVYSTTEVDNALALKADLTGATFSGKVNHTSVGGAAGVNIGIGGTSTNTVAGDLWISTGGTNLNFRDSGGAWRVIATQNQTNSFSTNQIISGSTTTAMLRVTQTGTGEALRIEDETPETTPFVVGADGRVGIHGTPALNTNHKLAIYNGNIVFSAGFGLAFGDGSTLTSANNLGVPSFYDLQGVAVSDNQTFDARNGSFLRFYRQDENSPPFVVSRPAYWWNFPKNNETMPNAVLTASFNYNDGFGNSMYGTVTVQVAFSKYIPRLNTGQVVLSIGGTTTHSWSIGNKIWSQGTEYYGDILNLTVVDDTVDGSSYSDANEGISFSASVNVEGSEGSPPTLTWGMVSTPIQTSYTLPQSEADSRDEPVMKRGLLSSFIQEIVGDKGFSLVLGTVPNPRYNLVWNANTDKFEIDRTLAASVETLQTDLTSLQGSLANYAVKAGTNTFTQPQIITSNSASLPALRVTNTGVAATILVEDNTNPDTTAFVVNNNGAVGIQRPVGWSPAAGVFLDVNGKGVFTPTATHAGINIGTVTATPTSPVSGDIWIGTALNFRGSDGSNRTVPVLNTSNVFTANTTVNTLMTINQTGSVDALSVQTSNASNTAVTATFQQSGLGANVVIRSINTGGNQAALRVEQRGLGHALVVEDSQNPDTNSFVIDTNGNVGIGVEPATFTATEKLEVKGNIKFNDGTVQSTAFTTAQLPTVANITQARGFNNTANFLSPQMANWLMMSPNIIDITRAGFTITNTGTITTTTQGWISSYTRTGTAGACSSRWRTFGLSQIDQVWSMTEKSLPQSHFNFSNPSWCSGRSLLLGVTESVFAWGFYHGKADGDGVGQLTRRGYGWRCTGGAGSRFLTLEVHDGTTLTSVTSTYAVSSSVAFDWDLISDGAGTVTLYVNGTQVATTTGGPTGTTNLTPAVWQEEVETSAASVGTFNGMVHSRGKFIAFDPS